MPPPYSSAKDPVNMAGFLIDNLTKGHVQQWHPEDVDTLPRDGSVTLLDTRTVREYSPTASGTSLWMSCGSGSVSLTR